MGLKLAAPFLVLIKKNSVIHNSFLCLTREGVQGLAVQFRSFLISKLDRCELLTSHSGHFTPGKQPCFQGNGPPLTSWGKRNFFVPSGMLTANLSAPSLFAVPTIIFRLQLVRKTLKRPKSYLESNTHPQNLYISPTIIYVTSHNFGIDLPTRLRTSDPSLIPFAFVKLI